MEENMFEVMFENYQETKIILSNDAETMLEQFLLAGGIRNILLCTGGASSMLSDCALQRITRNLGEMDFEVSYCRNIPAEPSVDDVRKIVEEMKKEEPECVIAIGGGSVMDAAKAAYLSWQSNTDVTGLFGVNKISSAHPDRKFKRVICIPTTSGTGSEATNYSNIVDHEAGVKKLIMENAIVPEWAFLNPHYTKTMPKSLTVTTALDALVHAIESLLNNTSPNAPEEAPEWALEAIRLIAKNLPVAVKYPEDIQARNALSAAAALGGMCIRHRPTSLPHLTSFSLYGKVSHGVAVAALLPAFWRYYTGEEGPAKTTMSLAGIFSPAKESDAEEIISAFENFVRSVGGIPKLSELGLERSLIEKIAADAILNPVKLQSCPRKIDPASAKDVIADILGKAW